MAFDVCIFEDEHFNRLHPLTLTRPVFDLRRGKSLGVRWRGEISPSPLAKKKCWDMFLSLLRENV